MGREFMSNQPVTVRASLYQKLLLRWRSIAFLGLLIVITAFAGCRLWDPEKPGGKTAGFSVFGSNVPKQTEPVVDEDNLK